MKELLTEFLSDLLAETQRKFKAVSITGPEDRVTAFGSKKAMDIAIAKGTHRPYYPDQDAQLEKPEKIGGTELAAMKKRQGEDDALKKSLRKVKQDKQPTPRQKSTKIPDVSDVTARLGEEVVAEVTATLQTALGELPKNDIIGGDSDQKRRVLAGELKVPGQGATATGPVHEVTVGLALDVIMKHPELADEDITALVSSKLAGTKLGSSLEERLSGTILKAVKSARAEATRLTLGIRKNGMNPDSTVSDHYHGNEESKNKLVTDVLTLSRSGYTIVTADGNEISREDIPGLIKSSGSSTHGDLVTPGDTFVVSVDPKTKKVILGTSSNKTARNDQSLNTTILKELRDYRSSLEALIQSEYLSASELQKVEQQLKNTDDTIEKLSADVSSAFSSPVSKLQEPQTLQDFITYVTEPSTQGTRKNLPKYFEKFTSPYLGFDVNKKRLTKKEQRIKSNLEAVGWTPGTEISTETAAAAWVHDMKTRLDDGDENTGITGDEAKLVERFFQTRDDGRVDTSEIRKKALAALQDRHKALSTVMCTIDGTSLPVSQAVLGIFTARALHLEESLNGIPGVGKVYTQYKCYFKAVTGDIVGYPEANIAAVGTDNFVKFCQSLELSEPKIAVKKGSEDDAGTITFDILSVTSEGQKRSICARVVRTKGGTALSIVAIPLQGFTNIVAENQPKI